MTLHLHGKSALVTGGTGALGSVIARRFLDEGMNVAATFRSQQQLEQLDAELRNRIFFLPCDVTVEAEVRKLFDTVTQRFGQLDVLVNTVGGFRPGNRIAEMKVEDWEYLMSLNLRSTFLCLREGLKRMSGQSYGRIVNVSAMTALRPSAGKSAYAISKAGVNMLTEIAAEEVKRSGITVNAIAPSIILTKANQEAMADEDTRPWVKPEDIAGTVCYLCSEEAGRISGTIVRAVGGV